MKAIITEGLPVGWAVSVEYGMSPRRFTLSVDGTPVAWGSEYSYSDYMLKWPISGIASQGIRAVVTMVMDEFRDFQWEKMEKKRAEFWAASEEDSRERAAAAEAAIAARATP